MKHLKCIVTIFLFILASTAIPKNVQAQTHLRLSHTSINACGVLLPPLPHSCNTYEVNQSNAMFRNTMVAAQNKCAIYPNKDNSSVTFYKGINPCNALMYDTNTNAPLKIQFSPDDDFEFSVYIHRISHGKNFNIRAILSGTIDGTTWNAFRWNYYRGTAVTNFATNGYISAARTATHKLVKKGNTFSYYVNDNLVSTDVKELSGDFSGHFNVYVNNGAIQVSNFRFSLNP